MPRLTSGPLKTKWNFWLAVLLLAVFAITRWPGVLPPNFSAAYALVFCAGAYFPGKLAWWLPLGTLLLSDIAINLFHYHTDPVGSYMLVNYLIYAALIWLGKKITGRAPFTALLGGGILGAIIFYLVTNTFAWLEIPEYAKTLAGWIKALSLGTDGWPYTWEFFRNTLLSGGLFTSLFVGAMKLSEAAEPEPAEEKEAEPTEAETEESKA